MNAWGVNELAKPSAFLVWKRTCSVHDSCYASVCIYWRSFSAVGRLDRRQSEDPTHIFMYCTIPERTAAVHNPVSGEFIWKTSCLLGRDSVAGTGRACLLFGYADLNYSITPPHSFTLLSSSLLCCTPFSSLSLVAPSLVFLKCCHVFF